MTAHARTRLEKIALALLLAGSMSMAASCAVASDDRTVPELTQAEQAAVEVAKRALTRGEARAADNLRVRSVEPKQWNDSSLGCPQPGLSYLQVITDGYVVVLESQGKRHEVHVAGGNAVICSLAVAGKPRVPRPGAIRTANLDEMERNAKADLAQRLGASPDAIQVKQRIPQRWQDESLGCTAAPETRHMDGAVGGFKLLLSYQDRLYSYHTDLTRVMACPPIEKD